MPKSKIFYKGIHEKIETQVKDFLNQQEDFLSSKTSESPRAVGEALEAILAENFGTIIGDLSAEYSQNFARRAMADFAFTDKEDFYYIVDVKSHRLDTNFNMPNLTSVKRLARFYEDDKNYFTILKIDYEVKGLKVSVNKVLFAPIEFFSWKCLTLGALGWGQIQIANANTIALLPKNQRKDWMIEMCDNLLEFYSKEISKVNDRIDHFKKIKKYWQNKK